MAESFEKKHPVLAVVGPTATGKTALGVVLAEQFGGEIISADSMQIYKGLDVGTAKVTPEECTIRHWKRKQENVVIPSGLTAGHKLL